MSSGVLFDLDETLIDRRGTLLGYAARFHREFSSGIAQGEAEFLRTVDELDGFGRTPRGRFFQELAERACTAWSAEALERHFYENAWREPEPFPGVEETLVEIRRRGLRLGIVTNGRGRVQSAKLANSGLARYFDEVAISEEVGRRKPDPEIFLHIAERLQIEPESSWHVGDDPVADIEGAASVGFATVWVERHLSWPEGRPACYRLKASRISDILPLLPTGG